MLRIESPDTRPESAPPERREPAAAPCRARVPSPAGASVG